MENLLLKNEVLDFFNKWNSIEGLGIETNNWMNKLKSQQIGHVNVK